MTHFKFLQTEKFLRHKSYFWRFSFSIMMVGLGVLSHLIFDLFFQKVYAPFSFFYPVIFVTAWYAGFFPGVLSILLSAFAANFLFIEPKYYLNFSTTGIDLFYTLLFCFISSILVLLSEKFHRTLISERFIEEELHHSQIKVRGILENVTGCFFTLDRNWRFVYINLHCKDYLPYSPNEVIGKNLWEVYSHWLETDVFQQLSKLSLEDKTIHFEFFDSRKSHWYEMHASSSFHGYFIHFYDITSRKKSEEALVVSESKLYRTEADLLDFFENAIVPIHWLNADGTILRANKAELKLLGYTPEEYIGHSITEFHVDLEVIQDILNRLNNKETLNNYEAKLRCKDGSVKYVLIDSNVLWENGKFVHSRSFLRDITSQKWEDLQRETEYLITQTLSVSPTLQKAIPKILHIIGESFKWEIGAFWKIEEETNLIRCLHVWQSSPNQAPLFVEYSKKLSLAFGMGIPGKIWKNAQSSWIQDIHTELDLPRQPHAITENLHSAFAFPILLNKDVLGVIEFFSHKIKQPDKYLLQMFDVIGSQIGQFIERKEAEEALHKSEQQFQLALKASQMGYWSWDIQKDLIKWAEHVATLHGLEEKSFEGSLEEYLLFVEPEDREFVRLKIFEAIEKKSEFIIEFRIIWADKTVHWIHSRGQVFYDEEDQPTRMLGFAIDVTNKKETEEKLKLAYEKMELRVQERTAELQEINQALQIEIAERKKVEEEVLEISLKEQRRFGSQLHDGLCQDLAGLLMLMKVLIRKMEKKGDPEASELKNLSETLHLAVNQARDMARGLYPVELEGTSLMSSLHELTSRTQSIMKISCRFECPKPIRIHNHDMATHLYRIAQEGINNAVKHGAAQEIVVTLSKNEEDLILSVEDNGTGVLPSTQSAEGIGLHIMKYRARMINALLRFESNVPHGTKLLCILKAPTVESLPLNENNQEICSS